MGINHNSYKYLSIKRLVWMIQCPDRVRMSDTEFKYTYIYFKGNNMFKIFLINK